MSEGHYLYITPNLSLAKKVVQENSSSMRSGKVFRDN